MTSTRGLSDAQLFVLQTLFAWEHHHEGGATRRELAHAIYPTIAVLLERGLIQSQRSVSSPDLPGYRMTELGRHVLEREDRAI